MWTLKDMEHKIENFISYYKQQVENLEMMPIKSYDKADIQIHPNVVKYLNGSKLSKFIYKSILCIDMLFPRFRRKIMKVQKTENPMVYGHILLSDFFNPQKLKFLIDRMFFLSNEQVNTMSWGLPMKWAKPGGLVLDGKTSNAYTTFWCAYPLFKYNKTYSKQLKKICNYYSEVLNWISYKDTKFCFVSYTEHETDFVLNVNSSIALFLARYMNTFAVNESSRKYYINKVSDIINLLHLFMSEDGEFPYSNVSKICDCYHTAMLLGDLIEIEARCAGNFPKDLNSKLTSMIERGVSFFFANFIYKNKLIDFLYSRRPIKDIYSYAQTLYLFNLISQYKKQYHYYVEEHYNNILESSFRYFYSQKHRKFCARNIWGFKYDIYSERWGNSLMFINLTSNSTNE